MFTLCVRVRVCMNFFGTYHIFLYTTNCMFEMKKRRHDHLCVTECVHQRWNTKRQRCFQVEMRRLNDERTKTHSDIMPEIERRTHKISVTRHLNLESDCVGRPLRDREILPYILYIACMHTLYAPVNFISSHWPHDETLNHEKAIRHTLQFDWIGH